MNPGSVVATVCGGIVAPGIPAGRAWDGHGWGSAHEATLGRRQEDSDALECLSAVQLCSTLLDVTYRDHGNDVRAFAAAVEGILDEVNADRIAVPLATGTHIDHMLTRDGALAALKVRGVTDVFFYADMPYFNGHATDEIAHDLHAIPIELPPADDSARALKREAVAKYRSQLPLLKKVFRRSFRSIFLPEAESLYKHERALRP